jgi:uncharacterized repeat protein (TIGR01451 family)
MPLPGSPVIDAGSNALVPASSFDQRGQGFARIAGASADIGAVETGSVQSDLAITKTDGESTTAPGQIVTYTIVVSNSGPGPASATVTDTVPAALTGATWTCVASGGTCSGSGSGSINDAVTLTAGGTLTYTLSGTVDPAATGTLVNTASVASPTDGNPANNSATDTDALSPEADLSVSKTDGETLVYPRQTITYTIVASNAGPSVASGAVVSDSFPAAITGVAWTCVGAGGGACAGAGVGDILENVVLPPGGTVTFTVSGTVDGSATGLLSNTVSIAPPSGVPDPVSGNDSATDIDTVIGCGSEMVAVPDGRITGTTAPGAVDVWVGATVTIGNSYSVEFRSVTDTVPPGTLAIFSGDDACSLSSTVAETDTSLFDPSGDQGVARQSFTAEGTLNDFRARLSTGGTVSYTFSWSDTTMFSPAWSTNGSFNTFYSFQNTTGATLHGRLTLLNPAGTEVISTNVTIAPGQTVSVNTATLGTPRNQTGTAKFTHDGPPGAILAEAAIANFSISPAYVQPVKFQAVREAK